MKGQDRFELALQTPEPARALRELALQLANEGLARSQVYDLFEGFLRYLRAQKGTPDFHEDLILDAMDALSGWCHCDARLLTDR